MRGVQHGTNKPLRKGKGGLIFADNAHPAFQIQFCLTTTNQKPTKLISLTTHKFTTPQILKQYDIFYKTHLVRQPILAKTAG